jgi:2,4-dienoyl-CoA reductase-like NADH-dependent reductase (Old Yellow Enzyme family)
MISSTKFRKLLEPGYIGSIRTRNRLLKTGSTLGFYSWEDDNFQQKAIDSYEVLAKVSLYQ